MEVFLLDLPLLINVGYSAVLDDASVKLTIKLHSVFLERARLQTSFSIASLQIQTTQKRELGMLF